MKQSSSMREAFFNMQVPNGQETGSIIKSAIHAAQRGAGIRQVKDWNAHLKLRTYNRLLDEQVMV